MGVGVHRAFRDGVWRADFSATQDSRFVVQTVQDAIPGPDSVRSLADQIGEHPANVVVDDNAGLARAMAAAVGADEATATPASTWEFDGPVDRATVMAERLRGYAGAGNTEPP